MAPDGARTDSRVDRQARIEQAALELFRARGFDNVTVEEVCAAAAVAPATFYRHFGTKEAVVFAYRDAFAAAMGRAIDGATAVPDGARLATVVLAFADFLESQQDVLALRDSIVVGNPRLLQRTLWLQREFEGVLAAGLARQRGADEPGAGDLLEAGLGMLVLRLSVRAWRSGEQGSLAGAARATFTRLQSLGSEVRLPER